MKLVSALTQHLHKSESVTVFQSLGCSRGRAGPQKDSF